MKIFPLTLAPFFGLLQQFHPDSASSPSKVISDQQQEQFRLITAAYQTLSNPNEKNMYDFRLSCALDADSVDFLANKRPNAPGAGGAASPFAQQQEHQQQYTSYEDDPFAARRDMYASMFRTETPDQARQKRAHRMKMMWRGFSYMGLVCTILFVGKFYLVKKVYMDHVNNLDKQAEHALQRTSDGTYYVSKKDIGGSYYSKLPASAAPTAATATATVERPSNERL